MMSSPDTLDSIVASFLEESGMGKTAFGLAVANDGSLVSRIEAGRDLRWSTVQRISGFIEGFRVGRAAHMAKRDPEAEDSA